MFNSALLDALSLLSIFEKEAGGSPMKDLLPLKTAEETSTFGLILVEWISSVNTDDKGSNWKDDDEVKRIVRCCVDSPSAWSLSILEKISASSKGREVARALEYLRGFQSFFDEKPSISSATSELGMEEVCKDLSMWEERSQRRHAPSMRGWSVVEDWLPCPIGTVFGKQVSLRLGEEDCKEEQTETVLDTALPPFPRAHEQAITSPREEAEGGRTERACSPVDKGACAVSDLIDETWIHKTSSMIKLLV
ncbi:hypothetical protein GUITHDRAFT_100745 [Guillardia theta CCMP2712]|uniref:Uncharacterized protein n=1 Tax=Guillardia theta (strain CCMP2712) TaxID=905079 RepID=L1K031_GUITC|nr:hypothetical protein GUITHDRAFT_100745 [Guillardia theta CCMP2712]EKX53775.1 hypothetical protein GUITHDRAFT_100745 [Guillardia theta CCMP2712]|eukprot:XP_005840755.1 hypothetical protein GUITHDRAFT_100745 [Guillardia theta CCMP2712]